jgi:hypothetical protein
VDLSADFRLKDIKSYEQVRRNKILSSLRIQEELRLLIPELQIEMYRTTLYLRSMLFTPDNFSFLEFTSLHFTSQLNFLLEYSERAYLHPSLLLSSRFLTLSLLSPAPSASSHLHPQPPLTCTLSLLSPAPSASSHLHPQPPLTCTLSLLSPAPSASSHLHPQPPLTCTLSLLSPAPSASSHLHSQPTLCFSSHHVAVILQAFSYHLFSLFSPPLLLHLLLLTYYPPLSLYPFSSVSLRFPLSISFCNLLTLMCE